MDSVDQNEVTFAQSANATGKTHAAASIIVAFYKRYSGAQVYTAAAPPEGNLRRLLWGEIGKIRERHPRLFRDDSLSSLNIQRSAAEFITGVTIPASGTPEEREARFSGKHSPYILFVLDEGDGIPAEVYKGIESCMSGGHIRLLILFNPRRKSGPVWRKITAHEGNLIKLSAFSHPNVLTGQELFPGAVSRAKTVQRINQWSRPLTLGERINENCFEVPDFLVGEVGVTQGGALFPSLQAGWRYIHEPTLYYMTLGEFPPQGSNQLINETWINDANTRWLLWESTRGIMPPQNVRPIIGQDVAELGQDENVLCARYGSWVAPLVTWSGVDTLVTGERAARYYHEIGALKANVDGSGVGAGVWPVMNRHGCNAYRVMTGGAPKDVNGRRRFAVFEGDDLMNDDKIGDFGLIRDELWWRAREWLRTDKSAMLPPDEALKEELLIPTYSVDNRGKLKITDKTAIRELIRRSCDKADAFVLTFAETEEEGISTLGVSSYA